MSANKYKPHVYLILEDDANRQLAVGFLGHEAVAHRAVEVRAPAGGWFKVLDVFEKEYVKLLRGNQNAHVVMLIDFDERVDDRSVQFEQRIPGDVRHRVFIIGSKDKPETLRADLGKAWERIGRDLAQDCLRDEFELWRHPHLIHNSAELQRMVQVVKPILFQAG